MDLSVGDKNALQIFARQYRQVIPPNDLQWPSKDALRKPQVQSWLLEHLYEHDALEFPPPDRYQTRVLKELLKRIEDSILDPEEDDISDGLSSALATLMSKKLLTESAAVQMPSYVTYTFFTSPSSTPHTITLLESRSVIISAGTTGLRTWESALHLGSYLVSSGRNLVRGKRVLELGAGTGLLSILCARHLHAKHTTATDGDDGIIEALETNIFLNGLQENGGINSRSLKWGRNLDEGENGERENVDLVIGADITYDIAVFPLLVSTFRELFLVNRDLDIVIAAVVRNAHTFQQFLSVCERNNFDVVEIEFTVPPQKDQRGPFYSTPAPIRIVRIRSTDAEDDPFAG